jgi:Flp pilus assembly protein TadD
MSEAMTHYFMALELNPESDYAYGDIGSILASQGKTEMAAVYYQKALKRNSRSPSLHNNYGIVLVKLGHGDEALKEFSAAAQVDETDAQSQFLIGRLLLEEGRDVEALPHLHKALQLAPNNLELLIFTICVRAANENPQIRDGKEALMLATKTVKLTGGQPGALDALAMACAETGQFDQAVQIQQLAVKLIAVTGTKDDVALLQRRLQSYQAHQPWRESFKTVEFEHPAPFLLQ